MHDGDLVPEVVGDGGDLLVADGLADGVVRGLDQEVVLVHTVRYFVGEASCVEGSTGEGILPVFFGKVDVDGEGVLKCFLGFTPKNSLTPNNVTCKPVQIHQSSV